MLTLIVGEIYNVGIDYDDISGQLWIDKCAMGKEECSSHQEQDGNCDPGYSGSQQSESESSGSKVVLEMEDVSTFSQTSEAIEKTLNFNISLSEYLEGKLYFITECVRAKYYSKILVQHKV